MGTLFLLSLATLLQNLFMTLAKGLKWIGRAYFDNNQPWASLVEGNQCDQIGRFIGLWATF